MTREELQKRLIRISGQSQHNKAIPKNMNRRGENFIEVESDYEADEFDNFFNFEEDLADMESARRQVERFEMEKIKNEELITIENKKNNEDLEQSFFVMSEFNEVEKKSGDENIFFTFNELEEIIVVESEKVTKNKYNDVVGFEFEYCSFVKKDGVKCKRQSPKNSEYCSTHRKYIDKHGK
jgi:hypothetical protein